jgi:hypothetical protein
MSGWLLVYVMLGLMAVIATGIVVALVAIPVTLARRRVRTPRPGAREGQ